MLHQLDSGSYFGETKHLYGCGGLTVAETVYPQGCVIPPHEHCNSFFCFVLEGVGTRSWPGRAGAERPMALTLFPSGHAHANCWCQAGRVLHVEFAPPWLERLRGLKQVLHRPADFERGAPTWLAHRIAGECRTPDSVSPLMIDALALELLAECTRAGDKNPAAGSKQWLMKAHAILRERFADNLSLVEIADSVGVSADHLARAFRKRFGTTVGSYVRRLRVEFVCEQLAASDRPLAELAIAAGFTDQSHLTRVFGRQMSMTPAAFRAAQHRGRWRTKK